MLLFLDFDGVLQPLGVPVGPGRVRSYSGPSLPYATVLTEILDRYLPSLDVVVSSTWARTRSTEAVKGLLPPALAERVIGTLWEHPPPRPLSRYRHIQYWLKRVYVTRPPSWLALDDDARGWPEKERSRLIHCAAPIDDPLTQQALLATLGRFYWSDLGWGSGPAPQAPDLRRAHKVMVTWQIPKDVRPVLLGSTREEFELRLDLLLTVFAVPHWPSQRELGWPGQWLHLPCKELDGERPLQVMLMHGPEGIRRVRDLVWSHWSDRAGSGEAYE